MTPREYFALKRIWASKEASFHNAHFRGEKDLPFIAEDFINSESRNIRKAQQLREKADTMTERSRLELMKAGERSESVPMAFMEIGKVN
jgi:hypothetical protein